MEYCLTRFWSNTERKYLKALLFGGLELLVNVQSKFNTVIKYNYHWDIIEAINQTNFQGLMFYPCLYKSVRKTIVLTNEKPAEWHLYQFSRFESCFSLLKFFIACWILIESSSTWMAQLANRLHLFIT